MKILRQYPLSLLVLAVVLYLSFFTPPETPFDEVRYIDKWTHLCMYGGVTATWLYEYFRQHGLDGLQLKTVQTDTLDWRLCRIFGLYYPIILGGLVEVLQQYCTNHRRSGEVIDWIADALGSLLTFFIIRIVTLRAASNH